MKSNDHELSQGALLQKKSFIQTLVSRTGIILIGFILPSLATADESIVIQINSADIVESSGLAGSNLVPSVFWTHNDSGDDAILYAFNTRGEATGSIRLNGVDAVDWEDMSSFVDNGKPRLIVGDFGDNQSRRESISIYLLDEPDPLSHSTTNSFQSIRCRYPDGPRDCEAIAVDMTQREIYLITKSFLPVANCYSIALPNSTDSSDQVQLLTLRGTVAIPLVSSMDIDPRSGDVLVANYFQCFRFSRHPGEAVKNALMRLPQMTDLPKIKQIEAMAIDGQGKIWVTSEGNPCQFTKVSTSPDANSNDSGPR